MSDLPSTPEKSIPKRAPRRVPRTRTPTQGGRVANTAPQKVKLLFTVVNRSKAEFYMDLLHSFDVNLQLSFAAAGTASTETLRYLGLTDNEKTVIVSVIREDKIPAAMQKLEEKFETIRGGKGIAYTVPMSSTIGVMIYQFLTNNRATFDRTKGASK